VCSPEGVELRVSEFSAESEGVAGTAAPEVEAGLDTQLIHEVISRFGERLRRYLFRAIRPEDAEDALQEIYARLSRLAKGQPPPDFNATYVFKTADSVLRDLYRRRRSRASDAHTEISEVLASDTPSPFDEVRWRQNVELIRAAIRQLPPAERRVLLQHRVEGRSLTDISQTSRTPMRTVQRQLSQALARCRVILKDCGWFET
jgi:RNA polymerase sigma factor (sigma-70 family)